MSEVLAVVFLLLTGACALLAVGCLLTPEEALSAAIAKKLKIKPDAVTLMPFLLEKVDPA